MFLITKQDKKLQITTTYLDIAVWLTLAEIMKIIKYCGGYLPNPYSSFLKY